MEKITDDFLDALSELDKIIPLDFVADLLVKTGVKINQKYLKTKTA